MATMNISLPDPMRDWVEVQTKSGLYANNSDYVRDLIRKDQLRAQKLREMQHAITDGMAAEARTLTRSRIISSLNKNFSSGALKG